LRNQFGAGDTQERDGQIAKRSHDLGPITFANTAAVFVKGDIAHPMQAVLDGPMSSSQFKNAGRPRLLRSERCDTVDDFVANFASGNLLGVAFYAKDLSDIGKFKVIVEGGATPNPPDLQAAMSLFNGGVLRGEKRLTAGRQYPAGGFSGCLWR
jgi:hypothetical protein